MKEKCHHTSQIKINTEETGGLSRYFSPVSATANGSELEILLRFESHGAISDYFKNMKIGELTTLNECVSRSVKKNKNIYICRKDVK